MTNRRKGGRTKSATPKKTESSEKQTRRSHRRSKRGRKSVSPEDPREDSASEDSTMEETVVTEANSSTKLEDDSNGSDERPARSTQEDQTHSKGEESGGSEGGWKVKSENGGSGGIPKLKLCLQRPPEMSSPTPEQSSPKRKRRTRGTSTPTKDMDTEELTEEKTKSPKRLTRSTRHRDRVEEVVAETEPEPEPAPPETVVEVERQSVMENHVTSNHVLEEAEDEDTLRARQEAAAAVEAIQKMDEAEEEQTMVPEVETTVPALEEEEEVPEVVVVEAVVAEEVHEEEVVMVVEIEQPEEDQSRGDDRGDEEEREQQHEDKERRSPSRDSSEERAKEAALMSRRRTERDRGSEDGEVVDTTEDEKDITQHDTRESHKVEEVMEITPQPSEPSFIVSKQEDPPPVVRRRRWGSSSGRLTTKPAVCISTDVLREIIPEVKPVSMSEVQLSPNRATEEGEEGEDKDGQEEGEEPMNEEPRTVVEEKKQRMVQSDESEKDYEEEAGADSGGEETGQQEVHRGKEREIMEKERAPEPAARKVSVLPAESALPVARSPSPARNKASRILFIMNLVRPFTVGQLRELLARTGTIADDGFWIDKIKSKCYVKYVTEEEAKSTRHALHGVTWPVSNPKQLNVDYGTEAAMTAAMEGATAQIEPSGGARRDKERDRDKEREEREKERERDREEREKERGRLKEARGRESERDRDKEKRPAVEPLVRDRTVRRVTVPVREWDVGKNEDGFSPPPEHGLDWARRDERYERRVEYERGERRGEDERRRGKDRARRSASDETPRKIKKKGDDEAPSKLLDDLFRKTKATPCIYWLPLTAEQISVKEEMRRKHMAEHEKKLTEMRKKQREQANKRGADRRRRRSKSRSHSRSPKK